MVSIIMVNTWRGLPFFAFRSGGLSETSASSCTKSATIDRRQHLGRFPVTSRCPSTGYRLILHSSTTFSIILTFSTSSSSTSLTGGGPGQLSHASDGYLRLLSLSVGVGQLGLGSRRWRLSMVPVRAMLLGAAHLLREEGLTWSAS